MKRVILAAAAAASLTLVAAPAAAAQEIGPGSQACTDATAVLVQVQGQLAAALGSTGVKNIPALKQQLSALQGQLPALQQAVQAAIADDNVAKLPSDSPPTEAAKQALATLQNQIKVTGDLIAKAEDGLAKLRADVEAAVSVRDTKCAPPTSATPTPTPTTTAPPPVDDEDPPFANCAAVHAAGFTGGIPKSNPRFQDSLDSDNDGLGCEPSEGGGSGSGKDAAVAVVPNDAPETGDGSTEPPSFAHRTALAAILANFFGLAFLAARRSVFRP